MFQHRNAKSCGVAGGLTILYTYSGVCLPSCSILLHLVGRVMIRLGLVQCSNRMGVCQTCTVCFNVEAIPRKRTISRPTSCMIINSACHINNSMFDVLLTNVHRTFRPANALTSAVCQASPSHVSHAWSALDGLVSADHQAELRVHARHTCGVRTHLGHRFLLLVPQCRGGGVWVLDRACSV